MAERGSGFGCKVSAAGRIARLLQANWQDLANYWQKSCQGPVTKNFRKFLSTRVNRAADAQTSKDQKVL